MQDLQVRELQRGLRFHDTGGLGGREGEVTFPTILASVAARHIEHSPRRKTRTGRRCRCLEQLRCKGLMTWVLRDNTGIRPLFEVPRVHAASESLSACRKAGGLWDLTVAGEPHRENPTQFPVANSVFDQRRELASSARA